MKPSTLNREELVIKSCTDRGITPTAEQLEKANILVWYNKINNSSLRLTYEGYVWFSRGMKFHTIELADPIHPKQMLQLERLLQSPYYLKYPTKVPLLLVSNEQDAVMLQLHGGDLNTYLNNLEDNG